MLEFLTGTFRWWIAGFCFAALLLISFVCIFAGMVKSAETWRRRKCGIVLTGLAVAAVIFGGSKHVSDVSWDSMFATPHTATFDTNTPRVVEFAWNVAAGVPDTASAVFSAIAKDADGGVYDVLAEVGRVPMTNRAFSAEMPRDATNYLYSATCDWTPPQPVVTNGVYHVGATGTAQHAVPVAARVEVQRYYDTEVEWLSNSGSAYIDTGVKGSQVRGVRARYVVTSFASYGPLFNCYNGEEYNAVRLISQSANNGSGYASLNTRARGSLVVPIALNTWYDYRATVESGVFRATVNGTDYTIAAANGTANTKNVTLFGSLGARVSAFALYDADGNALIDLIPVRKDGVGYMFDRVSLRLFGNASSNGSFGIGPAKAN